jgi:hypothetical protein
MSGVRHAYDTTVLPARDQRHSDGGRVGDVREVVVEV